MVSGFRIENAKQRTKWLNSILKSEKKTTGEIVYVFCDDEFLLGINQSYLNHETLTDIITFPTSTSMEVVSGEIYISIPRVKENAVKNLCDFDQELSRVMVHGVLHLLGYNDGTTVEKLEMRAREDYYLNLQP